MWSTICGCAKFALKSQMAYRGAFVLGVLAQGASYTATFVVLWLIARHFGSLGGWTWPELVLLSGFNVLAYAIGAAFSFVQMRAVDDLVRTGEFDLALLKPMSPWAYLAFRGVNPGYLAHLLTATAFLAYAFAAAGIEWSLVRAIYVVLALVGGAAIHAALMSMIGAASVRSVGAGRYFALYFGFWEVIRYPLNMFPAFVQGLLLTVVPLGFVNYLPCALLLGKPLSPLLSAAAWSAPLLGPLMLLTAGWCWSYSIRHYQSAGG